MLALVIILVLAVVFSFLGAKSSYYILKFLAGASWAAGGIIWINTANDAIPNGSPLQVIIMWMFYIFGIAFMFYPFWRTGGESLGKIIPFWRSEEDDEESRHLPTRSERNDAYSKRINRALNNHR